VNRWKITDGPVVVTVEADSWLNALGNALPELGLDPTGLVRFQINFRPDNVVEIKDFQSQRTIQLHMVTAPAVQGEAPPPAGAPAPATPVFEVPLELRTDEFDLSVAREILAEQTDSGRESALGVPSEAPAEPVPPMAGTADNDVAASVPGSRIAPVSVAVELSSFNHRSRHQAPGGSPALDTLAPPPVPSGVRTVVPKRAPSSRRKGRAALSKSAPSIVLPPPAPPPPPALPLPAPPPPPPLVVGPRPERPEDPDEWLFMQTMDIGQAPNIPEAGRLALQVLLDLVRCDAGSVLFGTYGSTSLQFIAAAGPKAMKLRGLTIPIEMSIAGFCFRTGCGLLVKDASRDPRHLKSVDDITGYRTISMLAVPVRSTDGFNYGCIELLNSPWGFETWMVDLAQGIATTLAGAIAHRV
jgi:hypothetical protein